MEKEFILCAAVWIDDKQIHKQQPINVQSGFVISGRRHNNCYQTIVDLKGDLDVYIKSLGLTDDDYRKSQGFITSLDRFVSRKEAWVIAKENNQIRYGLKQSDNGEESYLISENLY